MQKTVCVMCGSEYRCKEIGVDALEMSEGLPYAIWHCDQHECRLCGHEILTGFGAKPIHQIQDADFRDRVRFVTLKFGDL